MPSSRTASRMPLARRYLDAVLRGDRPGAAAAIGQGLEAGLDAQVLLADVIGGAQREIGELWHRHQLSIAVEHRASEIAREEIERVRRARRIERGIETTAVVCAAPGEPHSLPA